MTTATLSAMPLSAFCSLCLCFVSRVHSIVNASDFQDMSHELDMFLAEGRLLGDSLESLGDADSAAIADKHCANAESAYYSVGKRFDG